MILNAVRIELHAFSAQQRLGISIITTPYLVTIELHHRTMLAISNHCRLNDFTEHGLFSLGKQNKTQTGSGTIVLEVCHRHSGAKQLGEVMQQYQPVKDRWFFNSYSVHIWVRMSVRVDTSYECELLAIILTQNKHKSLYEVEH